MRWPWKTETEELAPAAPTPPAPAPEPPPTPRVEEPVPAPAAVEAPTEPAPEPERAQEDKAPDPPAPAPAPSPAKEGGWSWLTSTRVVIAAATVPTLLSLVWTASTVAEIVGGPTGLAAGLLFDAVIVSTVAIAWVKPSIRTMASLAGWGGALLAAAVLAHHHWDTEQVAFAAGPVISKVLWFLALMGLTADEKVAAAEAARRQAKAKADSEDAEADDDALTVEQRRKVAAAKQSAMFKRKLADAQAEEAKADIYAENTVLMAKDQAQAERLTKRYELAGQVAGQLPIEILAHFMPGLGQEVPARATEVPHLALDRSRAEPAAADMATAASAPAAPVAGFGAGLVEASVGGGASPADLRVPPHAPPAASPSAPGGAPQEEELEEDLPVADRLLRYVADHGQDSTVKGAARALGVHPRTVRRYRDDLAVDHDMSALYSTQ